MNADAFALLWDARDAARRIGRFTQGKTFDDYVGDELLRAGVERQFEIIGEALSQLRKADTSAAATVSALPKAIGLRNILIHAYASIDHRIVWGVAQNELATLISQLDVLLNDGA